MLSDTTCPARLLAGRNGDTSAPVAPLDDRSPTQKSIASVSSWHMRMGWKALAALALMLQGVEAQHCDCQSECTCEGFSNFVRCLAPCSTTGDLLQSCRRGASQCSNSLQLTCSQSGDQVQVNCQSACAGCNAGPCTCDSIDRAIKCHAKCPGSLYSKCTELQSHCEHLDLGCEPTDEGVNWNCRPKHAVVAPAQSNPEIAQTFVSAFENPEVVFFGAGVISMFVVYVWNCGDGARALRGSTFGRG
jgi:hypothetical protein